MKLFNNVNLILHSIRFRLALWFVFILAILLIGFSSILFYTRTQELRDETLIRLEPKLESIEKAFGTDAINTKSADTQGFPIIITDDSTSFQKDDVLS